jgi:hypothetical protein
VRASNRSEFMAIPLLLVLLGLLFAVFAAATVGLWAWLLVGLLALLGVGVLAVRVARGERRGHTQEPPPVERRADPDTDRILLVADGPCDRAALGELIEQRAAGRAAEVFVVAPVLASRLDWLTGDETAYQTAQRHLDTTLAAVEPVSATRSGKVATADPVQAVDDALRVFAAEEMTATPSR